ncbi:MAG: response regulator transcription factor [Acholeplasmataceae bacterium]|nr:response regulator transcription factor [Acholeplasmataceae bacterium]
MAVIYFIEDDKDIQYVIEKTIENAGFKGLGFSSAQPFFDAYKLNKPDMVLLDIMLPDTSGVEILKLIRKMDKKIPVMMISALQNEMDKVIALDAGADDYMTKPFGVLELTSRLQARLRNVQGDHIFSFENVKIDDHKHTCMIDKKEVYLTNKEYDILRLLIKNQSGVVSKEDIFKSIWQTDFIGETRTLDMHIKSLRQKLKENQSDLEIKTIRGVGYQIK